MEQRASEQPSHQQASKRAIKKASTPATKRVSEPSKPASLQAREPAKASEPSTPASHRATNPASHQSQRAIEPSEPTRQQASEPSSHRVIKPASKPTSQRVHTPNRAVYITQRTGTKTQPAPSSPSVSTTHLILEDRDLFVRLAPFAGRRLKIAPESFRHGHARPALELTVLAPTALALAPARRLPPIASPLLPGLLVDLRPTPVVALPEHNRACRHSEWFGWWVR